MSEYTPITGELRDWFEHAYNYGTGDDMFKRVPNPWFGWRSTIEPMLDAIDAIHAQLERENAALKAELDRLMSEDERDGWVELPRDADGVPIRVGDVMVYADGNTCPLPVVALVPPAVFLTDDGPRYADMCRHAPDTWERIIADALGFDLYAVEGDDDFMTLMALMALVARCKALCARTRGDE